MLAALVGCGGEPLADDAQGKKACEALVTSRESDNVGVMMGSLLVAGKAAVRADTEAIRAAIQEPIEGLEQFPMVDQDALTAACEDAGVDVPARS